MTMTLVSTVTVGAGGAASIEWTGIPQTGTDLLVVLSAKAVDASGIWVRFNNDAGANYLWRRLRGNGSSADSNSFTTNGSQVGFFSTATSTFTSVNIYIPNYTSSNQKTISSEGTSEANTTTAYQTIHAGKWSGTDAITSLKIVHDSGTNLDQYSTASLYLITKGSGGATVS